MSCYKALIIWDKANSDSNTQTIKNSLQAYLTQHNFTGGVIQFEDVAEGTVNITQAELNKYIVVFHFHSHQGLSTPMPTAMQSKLVTYVNAGGVYVGSAWLATDIGSNNIHLGHSYPYSANMADLILFSEVNSHNLTYATGSLISGGMPQFVRNPGLSSADQSKYLERSGGIGASILSGPKAIGDHFTPVGLTAADIKDSTTTTTLAIFATTSLTNFAPFWVVKPLGNGFVHNINDALQLFGLTVTDQNNLFNNTGSSLFNGLVPSIFGNIIESIDLSIIGSYCIATSLICFRGDTLVSTDQGEIEIKELVAGKHSINNEKILHVTQTKSKDDKLIEIQKSAFGKNIPNRKTVVSKKHLINLGNITLPAGRLLSEKGVKEIDYNNEILYNILMEKYNFINVQNLLVETLHPKNILAKLYNSKIDEKIKDELLIELSDAVKNDNFSKMKSIKKLEGKWSVLQNKRKVNKKNLLILSKV